MTDPFTDGLYDLPGSKDLPRTTGDRIQYEMGRRVRGPRTPATVTAQDVEEAKAWLRWSLRSGLVGVVVGLGYGIWQALTALSTAGLDVRAVAVLKWTGIGAAAGAVLPVGLMLALGLGMIGAILWGLGQLLNLLTSL